MDGWMDLSCLIVPQCLRPQAYICEAILYYSDFLTLKWKNPFRKQVFWSPFCFPISSLAPGIGFFTICLCPCVFFRFVAPRVVKYFPGCKYSKYFWRICNSLIIALTFCVCVFLGDGSEEWKWAEWKSVEDFMAGGSAWRYCITVLRRPVHVCTGRSKTPNFILVIPPIAFVVVTKILIISQKCM